jgi:Tol biopolymer transport system component
MGLPPPDLVIVDNEGRVVGGMPGAYLLNWTPDGQGFFFVTGTENGPLQLAYLDGRPGRVFTDTYDVGEVAMSPDGRTIVYTEREYDRKGLWRVYVEGGKPVRVFAGRDLGKPAWSPNSKWVAFRDPGTESLWLIDLTSEEKLSFKVWGEPVWAPDSRVLALDYWSGLKGIGTINLIDLQSRQVKEIRFPDPDGNGYYSDLTWSPDSSQLAFILHDGSDFGAIDIWVINPDGSGLRRLTEDSQPKSQLRWIP